MYKQNLALNKQTKVDMPIKTQTHLNYLIFLSTWIFVAFNKNLSEASASKTAHIDKK